MHGACFFGLVPCAGFTPGYGHVWACPSACATFLSGELGAAELCVGCSGRLVVCFSARWVSSRRGTDGEDPGLSLWVLSHRWRRLRGGATRSPCFGAGAK